MVHDVAQLGRGNADRYGTDRTSGAVKAIHLGRSPSTQEKSGICASAQGCDKLGHQFA
jgi:hypothetical protein